MVAGCVLLSPPKREPAKELLSKLPNAIPYAHSHAGSLTILRPEVSPAYDTARMAYTERPYQLGYFRDHEWAEPPGKMIQKLLVETLEQTGFFRSVLTPPEIARAGYTLRTNVVELMQDYTREPPLFRLALWVELLGPSGQLLASRKIVMEEPIQAATPYAGVIAANNALARALQDAAELVLAHVR
jgi:cholesterol transport system auxiliary component